MKRSLCNKERSIGKGSSQKLADSGEGVGRHGMRRERSRVGSEFCLFMKWIKSYRNCRKITQRQLEQSDQVPDTKYAKKAKPTPEVRPLTYYSSCRGGGRGGRWPIEELGHNSSSVYSSSRLARGRGHTHWLGELKTTDSQFFSFFETYAQETPTAAAAAQQLHYTKDTII